MRIIKNNYIPQIDQYSFKIKCLETWEITFKMK